MTTAIRQADPERDRARLRELWGEYLTWANAGLDEHYGIRLPVDEILERNLADLSAFEPPRGRLLLAVDGDAALGIACLQPLDDEIAEVKRMYVRPQGRGTGLGRRLLESLLDAAVDVGYRHVRLDSTRFMHAAHALYRSAGFEEIEPYDQSEIPPEYRPYWVFMERRLER